MWQSHTPTWVPLLLFEKSLPCETLSSCLAIPAAGSGQKKPGNWRGQYFLTLDNLIMRFISVPTLREST